MIERIIVSVDGSALSEQALPFGSLLAGTFDCPIEIVHVIEMPMYVTIADPSATVSPEAVTQYLTGLAEQLPSDLKTRIAAVSGGPASQLLAMSEETSGAMIVMATHGRGGLPRALLGSVTDKVVRGATVPVGLVRAMDTPLPLPERLQRITIPLDGSELSEQALQLGVELATRSGATLSLLRVVEPISATPYTGDMYGGMNMDPRVIEDLIDELRQDARESLTGLSESTSQHGVPVEWTVAEGRPVIEILRHAEDQRANLILTTTHGRGGLSRMFLGSVATELINQSPLPLIVIPARATDLPEEHE